MEKASQNSIRNWLAAHGIRTKKITDRSQGGIPDLLCARINDGSTFMVEVKHLPRRPIFPVPPAALGLSVEQVAFLRSWPGETWIAARIAEEWCLVDPGNGMGLLSLDLSGALGGLPGRIWEGLGGKIRIMHPLRGGRA